MMFRSFVLVPLVVMLAASPALSAKLAVLTPAIELGPLSPTEARAAAVAGAIADAIAASASRRGWDVVTEQQIQALVGLESTRQLVGCDSGSCTAELAAALGVDLVLTARATLVGAGAQIVVKRIDARGEGGRVFDRRVPVATLGMILDAVPALVAEALAAPTTQTAPAGTAPAGTAPAGTAPAGTGNGPTASAAAAAPAIPARATAPAVRVEQPRADAAALATRLSVAVDDVSGRVVAFDAADPLHGPLFGGARGGPLYEARVIGGSTEGDTAFDVIFWDPRHRDGWQRAVGRKDKAGVLTLQCGDHKTPLRILPASRAKALLQATSLRQPPWRRALIAAGRDDDLNWYIVDAARDAGTGGEDLALYVGRKGRVVVVEAEGARVGDELMFAGEGVRLRLPPPGNRPGSWTLGGTTRDVRPVDIFAVAAEVYGVVRPWGEAPLGTPCDPGAAP